MRFPVSGARRGVRTTLRGVLAAVALLAAACSDGGPDDDTERPGDALNFLRFAADAPPLWNPVDSFYAKRGTDREVRLFFQNAEGGSGEEFLRFRVDANSLQSLNGRTFAPGDSVKIVVRVVDAARFLFEFQPAGLVFNPADKAFLRVSYLEADDDYDDDGDTDDDDESVEGLLSLWKQEAVGLPFVKVGSVVVESADEITGEIDGFTRFAIAY